MKNKLIDLNNHLFAQLERLSDEDLKEDELKKEIDRSKALTSIANVVVNNANVCLEAAKLSREWNGGISIPMLDAPAAVKEAKKK